MKHALTATALSLAVAVSPVAALADTATEIVTKAITEIFVNGNTDAIDTYFSEDYLQRNPTIPSGRDVIKELFSNVSADFKYEPGMIFGDETMVAVHARITGFGPKPVIAVDIFRVEDGLIAEHWDVLQEEVLETASGLPMFEPMK